MVSAYYHDYELSDTLKLGQALQFVKAREILGAHFYVAPPLKTDDSPADDSPAKISTANVSMVDECGVPVLASKAKYYCSGKGKKLLFWQRQKKLFWPRLSK